MPRFELQCLPRERVRERARTLHELRAVAFSAPPRASTICACARASHPHRRPIHMPSDRVASFAFVLCALAIGSSVVHREFFSRSAAAPSPSALTASATESEWRDAIAAGVAVGSPSAPITILEFGDLECPACRVFQTSLAAVRSSGSADVRWIFVHYPLSQHRFAIPAARAAECANDQHRFDEFVTLLYRQQDSLGLKPWRSFANDAKIADLAAFERCASSSDEPSRLSQGRALGRRLQISGTPTVFVNRIRFPGTPTEQELRAVVDSLRSALSR